MPQGSPLTALSLILLLVLGALLFMPLLGHPVPLVWVVVLLAVRLGLRVYQGYREPTLSRPAAWLLDAALLVLLLMQGVQHH